MLSSVAWSTEGNADRKGDKVINIMQSAEFGCLLEETRKILYRDPQTNIAYGEITYSIPPRGLFSSRLYVTYSAQVLSDGKTLLTDLQETIMPIEIHTELYKMLSDRGIKVELPPGKLFFQWLSYILVQSKTITKQDESGILCALNNLIQNSRFNDVRELLTTYVDYVIRENKVTDFIINSGCYFQPIGGKKIKYPCEWEETIKIILSTKGSACSASETYSATFNEKLNTAVGTLTYKLSDNLYIQYRTIGKTNTLVDVKMPIAISQELMSIAKSRGVKLQTNIDLSFYKWISHVMFQSGLIEKEDSPLLLCSLVALSHDSRFDDIRKIINAYINDISKIK